MNRNVINERIIIQVLKPLLFPIRDLILGHPIRKRKESSIKNGKSEETYRQKIRRGRTRPGVQTLASFQNLLHKDPVHRSFAIITP